MVHHPSAAIYKFRTSLKGSKKIHNFNVPNIIKDQDWCKFRDRTTVVLAGAVVVVQLFQLNYFNNANTALLGDYTRIAQKARNFGPQTKKLIPGE